MTLKRLLTNVCTNDLDQSKAFYVSLFDFSIEFDSDWFVQLKSKGTALELGIISARSEIVPKQAKGTSSGVYITFVVENVDEQHSRAKNLNYNIVQEPQLTPYGQKRMIVVAPEGTVCDVSSPSTA